MGWSADVPSDYLLIFAARLLGVPPWELLEKPIRWRNLAIAAHLAENEAENEALKLRR